MPAFFIAKNCLKGKIALNVKKEKLNIKRARRRRALFVFYAVSLSSFALRSTTKS